MNEPIDINSPELPESSARARRALSKRQIKATALADERETRQRWKGLLPEAKALWTKVPPEDLAKVNGNIHVLAGLVQLRYHTNRVDADQQVQQFFLAHQPAAATAAP